MKEKDNSPTSFYKEKFPILLSFVTGVVTIIYSLVTQSEPFDIVLSLIIVLSATFLLASLLKIYLLKKVFIQPKDSENLDGIPQGDDNSQDGGNGDDQVIG